MIVNENFSFFCPFSFLINGYTTISIFRFFCFIWFCFINRNWDKQELRISKSLIVDKMRQGKTDDNQRNQKWKNSKNKEPIGQFFIETNYDYPDVTKIPFLNLFTICNIVSSFTYFVHFRVKMLLNRKNKIKREKYFLTQCILRTDRHIFVLFCMLFYLFWTFFSCVCYFLFSSFYSSFQ